MTATNDAPSLSTQAALSVNEGGFAIFSRAQLASSDGALDVDIATGQQVIGQQMVIITSLPSKGTLRYMDGIVATGQVVPVTSLGSLKYTHNGTDLTAVDTDTFNITVSDGGGGQTTGAISISINPSNVAPTITGNPSLIEGQVKAVAPTIHFGDTFDTLSNATIKITALDNGGQGTLFFDTNNDGNVDSGEAITAGRTFTSAEAANLMTHLKYKQDGTEPNLPSGVSKPTYTIEVTDAGGGVGSGAALTATKTITIDVLPNNDDPTLTNIHATSGTALSVNERDSGSPVVLANTMLKITDPDRDPSDTSKTTPAHQLVYTIQTRPTEGEIQLYVGGTAGYGGDGWITLGDGGRFTQKQIDDSHVRYYQTTNVTANTMDGFTFTVRDSAFGYDVWTDPSNPTSGREGGLRDTPTGSIATQHFYINVIADPDTTHDAYEGGPRPATPGYGGSNMSYTFAPGTMTNGNSATTWNEANVGASGGYVITDSMLKYVITRTDSKGTPDTSDDISITVPANETVYTLTSQPTNGIVQRNVSGTWIDVPTNGQFTQDDIDNNRIRFVHDGSENHTATFGYKVSDGTPNNYANSFAINVTPNNDRPTATGSASAQVTEGNHTVRLGTTQLGMNDIDLSQDVSKRVGEGAQDFLWFQVSAQPVDGSSTTRGSLERWNGSAWVAVTPGEWLPSTLLTTTADGNTSGLRYAHDGSEPLAYTGGPKVSFSFTVRDDLADPSNPFATNSSSPALNDGSDQSNQSTAATVTINITPVNDAPQVADKPGEADPTIAATLSGGGALTGVNQILTDVAEGGTATITNAYLTAIDRDNTTVQRQFRITSAPTLGVLQLDGKTLGAGSTFTQADIDANKLTYKHNGDEVGAATTDAIGTYHDKFHFVVNDGVLEDSGDPTSKNAFLITLKPMNDLATVTVPGGTLDVFASGGGTVNITGVSVDDPDLAVIISGSEEDFIRVEVEVLDNSNAAVAGAQLSYTGADPSSGTRVYINGKGSNKLIIQGKKTEVNTALSNLNVAFTTDEDVSTHKIRVTVDDQLYKNDGSRDGTGANGGITASNNTDGSTIDNAHNRAHKDIALRVSNTNDTPTITNGTTYTVNEDASVTLSGFTLSDADSFDKNVTVKVELFSNAGPTTLANASTEGKLTYSGLSNVTAGGNNTNTVTLTGSLANVQAALNQIKFAGAVDYNGTGTGNGTLYLKTTFTDFGHADVLAGNVVTVDNDITIVPVNDAPVLTVPGDQTMSSGTYIDITSGFNVQDTKDTNQGATDYVEVTLAATLGGSGYGTLSIQTPGDATVTGEGTATVTVKGTSAQVKDALNSLRYTPTSANEDKVITITATANDCNPSDSNQGNGKEGTGVDGNNTDIETFTITISGTNDAPVVSVPGAQSVAEDSSANAITGISYADTDDFGGIQKVTVSVSHGKLDFTTKTGLSVTAGAYASGTVTIEGTKANLNAALATLKYTPNGDYHGNDTLTVTADDKGLVGSGGVETDQKTVAITVTPVNDRPVATTDVTLGTITEDTTNPAGTAFNTLAFAYSDATDDQTSHSGNDTKTANTYVAIVGNAATAAQGTWQVSDGSGGWINIPTSGLSTTNALVFEVNREVRFVPATDFNGTPGKLTVRLADGSKTDIPTSTGAADTKNLTQVANGTLGNQTGSWNDANRTIGISVTAINDAPTKTGTAPTVTVAEDATNPAGQTVSTLFSGNFLDAKDTVTGGSSANAFAGVAMTGMATDKGVWEYNSGSGWTAVPSDVADNKAFILAPTDQLRFRPTTADYNGTPSDSLTVRLIDNSSGAVTSGSRPDLSGSNSGDTTQYSDSSNAVVLGALVTPQNDAPAFDHTASNPTATEDGSVGGTTNWVKLLGTGTVSDIDLTTTSTLNNTTFGQGSVTVALTSGITGDTLRLSGLSAGSNGITSITGGSNGASLVVNFTNAATLAEVKTVLESIEYQFNGDDPTNIKSGSARSTLAYAITLSDGNNDQGGGKDAGGPAPLTTSKTGTITLSAVNDPPVATNNSNSVTEDASTPAGGNVITDNNGSGLDSDPDTLTADLKITAIQPASAGSSTGVPSGAGGVTVTGKYGSLLIKEDGSYTYTLDDSNSDVNALKNGDTLNDEVFTYTLSDGAATDTATLTITINGHTDGAPSIAPVDGNAAATGEATVYEKGLTSAGDTTETTTGSITVKAPDGLKEITIGGTTFTLAQLQSFSTGTPSAAINTGEGEIRITGITGDPLSGSGAAVSYSYTLTSAQSQPGGAAATESTDSIALVVKDIKDATSSGTLTIQIIDDVPLASADTGNVKATETLTVSAANGVLKNDAPGADGWAVGGGVVGIVKGSGGTPTTGINTDIAGDYGTLKIQADGSYTYIANPAGPGAPPTTTDIFTYTVRDVDGDETTANLTITIQNNQPPVANDDTRTTPEDTPISGNVLSGTGGDVADSDPDGDTLTVTQFVINGVTTSVPASGSASVSIPGCGTFSIDKTGAYTFTPLADWHGSAPPITYTVDDGKGASNSTDTAILNITVTPVLDISNDTVSTQANASVTTSVLTNDSFEGSPVITATTQPSHGSVTLNSDGTITYTPNHGYIGTDSYTYTVTSGGVTETATVTINVINTPPVANDDTRTTPEDTPISGNVLSGTGGDVADSDPDGDTLTVTQFVINGVTTSVPASGSASVSIPGCGTFSIDKTGAYTFTPLADWHGSAPPITYTVDDGKGASNSTDTAILNITVTPVLDISNDTVSTQANASVTTSVLTNDSFEGSPVITATTQPSHGSVTLNSDGTITYTPNHGYIGTDSYTYTVTSGGVTETATVTINVLALPVEPPPVDPSNPNGPHNPENVDPNRDAQQLEQTVEYALRFETGNDNTQEFNLLQRSPVVLNTGPYFASERYDDVRRMDLPFHPIVYVNHEVVRAQEEREATDSLGSSDASAVQPNLSWPNSLGLGLGVDYNLFVTHAVQHSQRTAGFLRSIVDGRHNRLNLSSDGYLSGRGLSRNAEIELERILHQREQQDKNAAGESETPATSETTDNAMPTRNEVPNTNRKTELQRPAGGGAPSFNQQLRNGMGRLPLAPRKS